MKYYLSILALGALLLSGCTTGLAMEGMNGIAHCPPEIMQKANEVAAAMQQEELGQPRLQVVTDLGAPARVRKIEMKNGRELEVLDYRTGHPACRSMPTEEEHTPVVFENGKLIGYGNPYFDERVKPMVERDTVTSDNESTGGFSDLVNMVGYPFFKMSEAPN